MAPIHDAVEDNDLEEVVRLVEEDPAVLNDANVDSRETALHIATVLGFKGIATYLLDQEGCDINLGDGYGSTALHLACEEGHWPIVELLVSKGANLTIRDSGGYTPLMMAASTTHEKQLEIIKCLFDASNAVRETINTRGRSGKTALQWSAFWGDVRIVKLLMEAGANPLLADDDDNTPLKLAQERGNHDCIDFLQVVCRHALHSLT